MPSALDCATVRHTDAVCFASPLHRGPFTDQAIATFALTPGTDDSHA